MSPVVAPDVSTYQVPVDDSFNRDWFIFRVCFDSTVDDKAKHNLEWALKARASGKILGFTGYVVPLPGGNDAILASLDQIGFPDDAVVMIDAEKWNGQPYQINGDHSAQFNSLAARLRTRQQGRDDLVWAYGNRGPDLEVWPRKAAWLGWVVASYGGDQPDEPSMIGWQYTDGQRQYDRADAPSSTPPFGRCDHNILYKLPGADMPLTDADVKKIANAIFHRRIYADPTRPDFGGAIRQVVADADTASSTVAGLVKQVAALKAEVDTLKAGRLSGPLHVSGDLNIS